MLPQTQQAQHIVLSPVGGNGQAVYPQPVVETTIRRTADTINQTIVQPVVSYLPFNWHAQQQQQQQSPIVLQNSLHYSQHQYPLPVLERTVYAAERTVEHALAEFQALAAKTRAHIAELAQEEALLLRDKWAKVTPAPPLFVCD